MPVGSALSLLLALLSPSICTSFSTTIGLRPGLAPVSSAHRLGLAQRSGSDAFSTLCSPRSAGKARSCAITCRVSAPSDASPSQESMGSALASLQEIFPTATSQELRRFLNKQKGDVSKASTMYERYLEWREASLPVSPPLRNLGVDTGVLFSCVRHLGQSLLTSCQKVLLPPLCNSS